MQRLLAVQWVVLWMLMMLGVAASVYGSLSPWCIHLRHVPDFENFWLRWRGRGFYGVRDLVVYQLLLIVVGMWSAAGACGIQTSHITGVVDPRVPRPHGPIPFIGLCIPAVALTFAALPIDSEDPFFEIGWGPRTILVLLIYFCMPFMRPQAIKVKRD
eukprot:TRINITY_DN29414_c0_g1_i1.p1 TRINITY_DN29414_c0_g1~~TRINITY_DN29414_c0_g1_i1.p1  ORF type:complete len:178 (+),score=52.64 TRINITY_DN29414_c0_g1_i1:63-536(+)